MITLDAETRTLSAGETRLNMGVQGDVNTKEFIFQCPVRIDNDTLINECDVAIQYKNTKSGIEDIDDISNLEIVGLNLVQFKWKPKSKLFLFSGIVHITLWLLKYAEDDSIEYSWHSRRLQGIIHPAAIQFVEGLTPAQFEHTSVLVPTGIKVTEVD